MSHSRNRVCFRPCHRCTKFDSRRLSVRPCQDTNNAISRQLSNTSASVYVLSVSKLLARLNRKGRVYLQCILLSPVCWHQTCSVGVN